MVGSNDLLIAIEDKAVRGDEIVVVRVLNEATHLTRTIIVNRGETDPPLTDQKLTAEILAAVDALKARSGVTDLIKTLDEQGTQVTLAIEIVKPKTELLIFGAGHVGQAVASIGALIGYDVTVIDDREEFASRRRLPDPRINLVVSDYVHATERVTISPGTVVVIVTRGHQYDEQCLKSVIGSRATYVGMIGSKKRVLSVFKKLVDEGVPEKDLQRVHAPIGLRIGAKSPQEIAVSILAEVINHLNNSNQKGERNGI